jgi:hypothetical protein
VDFTGYPPFPPITEGQVFGAGLIVIFACISVLVARWREQRRLLAAPPDEVNTVSLTSWRWVLLTRALPFFLVGIALIIVSLVM